MQDRGGNDTEWFTHELAELVARGARLGHGLAFVRGAPLETVATSLGVHARVVDHARECLEIPERHAHIVRAYARASERPPQLEPRPSSPPPSASRPADVIDQAEQHPLGVQFLLCAPLETVAISFGVHPDLVSAARAHLADRGIEPDPAD